MKVFAPSHIVNKKKNKKLFVYPKKEERSDEIKKESEKEKKKERKKNNKVNEKYRDNE